MSSEQPGRLPASVYRRRRIVVGLGALAVVVIIALLIWGVASGAGSGSDPEKSPGASDTPKPTDTETTAADGSTPCDPLAITLVPVTDKTEYQAGENPLISMTITNSGAAACTFNVGTDAQLYSIVSGEDPIWNSRDCQTDAVAQELVLEPGVATPTTPFAWDRTRSSTDTCASDRPQVTAGGATYRLSVELGEAKSAEDAPFLLY